MAVLIFKPLEKCNSNCLYCDTITKRNNAVMELELLEKVFVRIGEFLESRPRDRLIFVWHGGEVCLLPPGYFESAREFQDKHCGLAKDRIEHTIQSNLTLLSQAHVDVFRSLGITNFGTSFEPIPGVRGFGARRDSNKYNERFFRGVELLEQNGLDWGVIYTAHRQSLQRPLDIFHYLVNLNPKSPPRFNFVRSYNDPEASFAITEEEFAHFLGAIFPVYWKNRERYGAVQPFGWYADAALHGRGNLVCEMGGGCSYEWLFVGPGGEAAHCGVAGDYEIFNYGNISDRTIAEILSDGLRDAIASRQTSLPQGHCKGCRFWGVCHGGCPVGSLKAHNNLHSHSSTCQVAKVFLEQYLEPVTGRHINQPPPSDESPTKIVKGYIRIA